MPSLPELQRGFATDLLSDAAQISGPRICTGKFSSERLLQVYRNNYFLSLTQALKDIHPVVNTLVGEGFFNYAADSYIRQHPSTDGNLHSFGDQFGNFLSGFEAAASLPYLADMARLDWACHCAFHAADTAAIPQNKLAQIPTARYADLRFSIAPSVTLLQSRHPIFTIWSFSQQQNDSEGTGVNLDSGGEYTLVHRPLLEVSVEPLNSAEFAFINSLTAEQTLGFAVEQAVDEDSSFDLNMALNHFLSNGVLTDLWLD